MRTVESNFKIDVHIIQAVEFDTWEQALKYRSVTDIVCYSKQVNFGLEISMKETTLFNIFTTFTVQN
jgi:hypothetical protein